MVGLIEQSTRHSEAGGIERVIGAYGQEQTGPTLLCIAGVHGNEPAGVQALARVFEKLRSVQPAIPGRVIGLAGNLPALRLRRRFVDADLNRQWSAERVAALQQNGDSQAHSSEDAEQLALLQTIGAVLSNARGPVYFLDLHTFSAHGRPFGIIDDTLANRNFARAFRVPLLLGLEERLVGTLHEYVTGLGHVSFVFEAGQHDDPVSVDRCEAAILTAMLHLGQVRLADLGLARSPVLQLARWAGGVPRYLEMRYRHHVEATDGFRMGEGFWNLQRVRVGQVVARDCRGEVMATETGRLLLPLYQGLGSDGFFVARPIRPFWMGVSALLRMVRLNRCVHWLPGVRRHPLEKGLILVNPRVAHWLVVEVFHLLGYRMHEPQDGCWVFGRRVKGEPLSPALHEPKKRQNGQD